MKTFLILFSLILSASCSQYSSPKTDDALKPVVEISPISNQTAENNPIPANEIVALVPVKVPALLTPEKVTVKGFLRNECPNCLKGFGLYDLEKQPIAKGDLEIRVWRINGLYMSIYKNLAVTESVFILKRMNGNWSAKVFRNTVKDKSRVKKRIETNLSEPKLGWENVWQNLVNNELLTFPDSTSGKVEYAYDANIFISESKVDGIFKTYEYAGSQQTREIRHTAKILNIIADEFDLEDF
jgi:hypothetical protein